MIREKFIDRLRKKYQQGGIRKYGEGGLDAHEATLSVDNYNDWEGWDAHQQEPHHTGGDTGSMYGPNSDNPTGPPMDYGLSWSSGGGGLGGIGLGIKGFGKELGQAADWAKDTWSGASNWGKAGIIGAAGAPLGIAAAVNPTKTLNTVTGLFGGKKKGWFKEGGVRHQTGGMYDQMQQYQEGGKYPHDMYNKKTGYKIVAEDAEAHNALSKDFDHNKMMGGGMYEQMQQYQMGGQQLPGGEMQPIPGSDAVEFSGADHDEGGIMMDPQTEVEDGETMDQVNIARGGGKRGSKQDYFFSSYLKTGGRSFADTHKDILANGGNQEDINMLAKMQEKAAGRNPKQVAGLGGMMKYKHGGAHKYQTGGLEEPVKPKRNDFKSSPDFMSAQMQYYKDLEVWETEQESVTNEVIPTQTDSIVNSVDTNAVTPTPDYLIEDEDADMESFEEDMNMLDEEEAVESEKENTNKELKERANNLAKQAKKLNIDLTPFQGGGGGLLPSQLDSLESAVSTAQTDFDTLKSEANDLNLEYKENVSPSKLTELIAASKRKQRVGDVNLPGSSDIPDNQPSKNYQDMQYYLDDPDLEAVVNTAGFGDSWMENADQEVLKAAGITSYKDMNTPAKVRAYQNAYNAKYPDNKVEVDGSFGEETITTGMISDITTNIPEVTVVDELNVNDGGGDDPFVSKLNPSDYNNIINPQIGPEPYNLKDDVLGDGVTGDGKGGGDPYKAKIPWQASAGMAAGLIPAAYSLFHKQPAAKESEFTSGFTSPVVAERGKLPRLERFDYNQDIANVGSQVRGMNEYIETSGGGPANMVNKMIAFGQGQKAKNQIRAAETRANVGVQNAEAGLRQNMELDNMKRAQSASIFNAQMQRSEAARKDQVDEANTARKQKRQDDMEFQKYAGMTSLGQSLQTGFGDILDYKADMARSQAIGAGSGNVQRDAQLVTAGYIPDGKGGWIKGDKTVNKFGGLRRLQNYNK